MNENENVPAYIKPYGVEQFVTPYDDEPIQYTVNTGNSYNYTWMRDVDKDARIRKLEERITRLEDFLDKVFHNPEDVEKFLES